MIESDLDLKKEGVCLIKLITRQTFCKLKNCLPGQADIVEMNKCNYE